MKFSTTKATLWANRALAAVMTALLPAMPAVLDWYETMRPHLSESARLAILIAFYCCALAVFPALWNLDVLLRNILRHRIFIARNVAAIRQIRWDCLAVALICLPAACIYPPLIFMSVIMFFLTLILCVLREVMAAAVEIREENDLTV